MDEGMNGWLDVTPLDVNEFEWIVGNIVDEMKSSLQFFFISFEMLF